MTASLDPIAEAPTPWSGALNRLETILTQRSSIAAVCVEQLRDHRVASTKKAQGTDEEDDTDDSGRRHPLSDQGTPELKELAPPFC